MDKINIFPISEQVAIISITNSETPRKKFDFDNLLHKKLKMYKRMKLMT